MKQQILLYLQNCREGKTSTEIGLDFGYNYEYASASVSRHLKALCSEGLVKKTIKQNPYTVTYNTIK